MDDPVAAAAAAAGNQHEDKQGDDEDKEGEEREGDKGDDAHCNRITPQEDKLSSDAVLKPSATTNSSNSSSNSGSSSGGRPLVLCINTNGEDDLFLDALMADGVPPVRMPEVCYGCSWGRSYGCACRLIANFAHFAVKFGAITRRFFCQGWGLSRRISQYLLVYD